MLHGNGGSPSKGMTITKWVDMGADVSVEIGIEDIRGALAECFEDATQDELGEDRDVRAVFRAYNQLASFMEAITDEQIAKFSDIQRKVIREFLQRHVARYAK